MLRFWSDRKGNVAIIFALVAVPLFGVMGAAIDYSMAAAHRSGIQKALDATALALTKIMPADEATLNKVGLQYFQANMNDHDLENLQLVVTPDVGTLRVSASGTYKVKMASIIGGSTIDVGASSEAKWSMGKVEIALVLDMSLSMQTPDPARIQALRASTVNLLNVLQNAAKETGDAKVAIVPFDGMINTGYTYATRPAWVRFDWWDENVGSCNKSGYSNKTACQAQFVCSKSQQTTQSGCKQAGGNWVPATWSGEPQSNWNGCVYDRNQNNDVTDTEPTGTQTYYPAAKCYGTPPQAITALSTDWNSLKTKANNLTPTGYTNIPIGLAWGWHTLSKTALYQEGAEYNTENLTKYIILMTDGYNTKNIQMEPGNCNTNGPVCPVIDARMEILCENIKSAGIKIYSVRLIAGNEALLQGCASEPSNRYYFNVQSADQLAGVFSAIGSEIASLHLSK